MDKRVQKSAKYFLPSTLGIYGTMFVLLAVVGVWLGIDLAEGRSRIVAERLDLAVQKSQFMSQWFGTTIISAEYVLRDILDKVTPEEINEPNGELQNSARLSLWLDGKRATVPGVIGLALYDQNCIFRAAADRTKVNIKSNLSFCVDPSIIPEDRAYVQYVPMGRSVSKSPAILVSRPYVSPNGHLLYGALAAFDLSEAQKWLMSFPVSANDILAIADGDDLLLARNPPLPSEIGKQLPGLRGPISMAEQRSSVSFVAVSPLDGRTRIYGLSKIENIPLVFVVGFDLANSLSEWTRRAWQLSAGFLGLIILYSFALRTHLVTVSQRDKMRELATTDPLTGVANRRHIVQVGNQEFSRSLRYRKRMSLIMVDIDKFKAINDQWGHPTGDRVIKALADTMTANAREQDTVGRLGGEEFVVVLAETSGKGAVANAERLREIIQNSISVASDNNCVVNFTVSIGVAAISICDTSFEDMLIRVDKALYSAKNMGRNKVIYLFDDSE
ncbi:MAG: GGDEF domain-containing protein [Solidesulfovibrio sp. DCME]|uniref:GGDEF domain-containing protein n=1 Tax=Solidesulfovibrio sp. DCME TaxID=3447380 RepID=UPI003D0B1629